MRYSTKKILVCTAVLFTAMIFSTVAFAGTGAPEQPSGAPPYGVAIQSDAQGTKLTGVVLIEHYNFRNDPNLADARFVIRLRKGNDLKTFFGEASNINMDDPIVNTHNVIWTVMKPQIIEAFFAGNTTLEIKLKALEEYGSVDAQTMLTPNWSAFVLADVVLAVK